MVSLGFRDVSWVLGIVWGAPGIPPRQAPVGAVSRLILESCLGPGCSGAARLLLDRPATCCSASVLGRATWVPARSVLVTVELSSTPVELLLRPAEHVLGSELGRTRFLPERLPGGPSTCTWHRVVMAQRLWTLVLSFLTGARDSSGRSSGGRGSARASCSALR